MTFGLNLAIESVMRAYKRCVQCGERAELHFGREDAQRGWWKCESCGTVDISTYAGFPLVEGESRASLEEIIRAVLEPKS